MQDLNRLNKKDSVNRGRPIVELIDITKRFGNFTALEDINIMFRKGEIHCLAGENGCGKSTLVKIVSGTYKPNKGSIIINGKSYKETSPSVSMQEGIQVIYQDLSLFNHMSVAENIVLGRFRQNNVKMLSEKLIYEIAQEQIDKIGVNLNLRNHIIESSIGTRQLVAICRALCMDAKVLFMDEPTTALTNKEVDRLLSIMYELKQKGLSIVFISHKLDEVFRISDVVTVFRDGKKIGDFPSQDLNQKRLSYYMTGKEVSYPQYKRLSTNNKPFIEIKNFSKEGMYKNINLSICEGDIIGLVGLLGSGRTEMALSLFGLNKADCGEIVIDGKNVNIKNPSDALEQGIALLPEDRATEGLFLERNISVNVTSAIIKSMCSKLGFFKFDKEKVQAVNDIANLNIRTTSENKLAGQLSGGNQQKVVLAKWLATKPRLFIMDNPTVGIDIGSKAEIYEVTQNLAHQNMSILLLSDEIDELISNCNKVAVMSKGQIVTILNEQDLKRPDIHNYINTIVSTGKLPQEVEHV